MSNRPRHIISDVDGVMLDWLDGFETFMARKGYEKIPNTDAEYSLGKRYPITLEKAQLLVREYNESDSMQNLSPLGDAVEYITKLNKKHGFKFTVVTAMSSSETAHHNRTINLEKHFGKVFNEVRCLEIGTNKYKELQRWAGSGFFWIEDHVAQARAGHESGMQALLMTDPTNLHRDIAPLTRVNNWAEVYNIVCEAYKLTP